MYIRAGYVWSSICGVNNCLYSLCFICMYSKYVSLKGNGVTRESLDDLLLVISSVTISLK